MSLCFHYQKHINQGKVYQRKTGIICRKESWKREGERLDKSISELDKKCENRIGITEKPLSVFLEYFCIQCEGNKINNRRRIKTFTQTPGFNRSYYFQSLNQEGTDRYVSLLQWYTGREIGYDGFISSHQ